jgi:uncharacterized protein (DUF1697 family)
MKYIALLRGINAGGNRKVEMKKLKALFECLGFENVSTYINSGNAIFEGKGKTQDIRNKIELNLKKEFGFAIPTLVKTVKEIRKITEAIPTKWQNDTRQRTDVAYLFPEIDSKKTIDALPLNRAFIEVLYVKGAIFWNMDRKNYGKSRLNKIIGHKLYQSMTMRNINTARYLARVK